MVGAVYQNIEARTISESAVQKLYENSIQNISQLVKSSGSDADFAPLVAMLEQLRTTKVTGRVVVDLNSDQDNTLIQNGDTVLIPEITNQVHLYGSLADNGPALYVEDKNENHRNSSSASSSAVNENDPDFYSKKEQKEQREQDDFDFYVVNITLENRSGQFVFPKVVLVKKGIVSTQNKEGKRAFRIYPSWDQPASPQAMRTQKWQLDYFYEIHDEMDIDPVIQLYQKE